MSIEAYERKLFESDIYFKLKEAEFEAKSTDKRFSHDEVFSNLKAKLTTGKTDRDNDRLRYLPLSQKDLRDITSYIADILHFPVITLSSCREVFTW